MSNELHGKRIAILATHGFEQSELLEPRKALLEAGARAEVVSPAKDGRIRGWKHGDWGESVTVDLPLDQADPAIYDGLLLPGGVMNPDRLRLEPKAIAFVKHFVAAGKPIAAICHGPWTLIDADAVRGKRVTSWPSIKADLVNAGAHWVDEEVVVDGGLVTSRKPDDIPAFNRKMIEALEEAPHAGGKAADKSQAAAPRSARKPAPGERPR
jgi:protease I